MEVCQKEEALSVITKGFCYVWNIELDVRSNDNSINEYYLCEEHNMAITEDKAEGIISDNYDIVFDIA